MAAYNCRGHHERRDGRGYPSGVSGEDIPLATQIAAIADMYDALRSVRPYKDAWSHEASVWATVQGGGSQFDLVLAAVFASKDWKGVRRGVFQSRLGRRIPLMALWASSCPGRRASDCSSR